MVLVGILFFLLSGNLAAKECNEGDPRLDEICRQLNQANAEYQNLTQALSGAEKSLSAVKGQIQKIRRTLATIHRQVKEKEKEILASAVDLEFQKQLLFARVRSLYIQRRKISPLLVFLATQNLGETVKKISYTKAVGEQDKKIIIGVSRRLLKLQEDKESLEKKRQQLAVLEKKLDQQAAALAKDIDSARNYQKVLSQKIAELTAEQQRILAEKTGVFQTSVGETPAADDPCAGPPGAANFCSPGFSPAFAAFSFGAPHRKGMSQYGAFGRAKANQDFETILKAYYGDIRIETIESPASIATTVGTLPFEDQYLRGIAEMPSSWGEKGGMEALKAQAVAARTYALAYTGWRWQDRRVKKSICTSEACQVYSAAKAANTPDTWRRAVEETRGKVIVSNRTGEIISAWYASTSGGFLYSYETLGHTTPAHWDTACGNQSCWPDQAYEKASASPWFYKGWYKTRSGKSCGRSHPWLNQEEFADIINALLIYTHDEGAVVHLSQADGCWGTVAETWSKEKVRQEAARFGGAVTQISGVQISYSQGGYTQEVKVSTNRGELSFSGDDFKTIFNLRAPGAIHLKSRLFNLVQI